MEKAGNDLVDFWNRRALTFPRYNEAPNSYEQSMVDKIEAHGLVLTGKTILDVGAGSGQYTLKLAKKAARVVALDVSDTMLAISKEDAARYSLTNIDYVLSTLADFHEEDGFDLVFCSMCPAVKDDLSRRRLLTLAREAFIHIGFERYVNPGPMDSLMAHYGVESKRFNSGPDMRKWLDDNGELFSSYPMTGTWRTSYSKEESLHWAKTLLFDYGVKEPDKDLIERSLEPFWQKKEDKYVFETPYFVELLIWERMRQKN
jgi:SAM-dependent methyltransferase